MDYKKIYSQQSSNTDSNTPQPTAAADGELDNNIYPIGGNNKPPKIIRDYPSGSILDMAYGGNDANTMAAQMVQGGEIFRLMRGYPYKRAGHMVPVLPQFKTMNITIQNLASQPQANTSVSQITSPKADPSTTNTNLGTPTIGLPGFNKLNIT